MRWTWLLALCAAPGALGACTVYGSDLLSTGAGGSAGSGGATGGAGNGGSAGSAGSTGTMTSPACMKPQDCPGMDTECRTRTCNMGSCDFDNAPANKAVSMQTAGDCKKVVCDGMGNTSTVADDSDKPDDMNDCTDDACSAGAKKFTPKASGSACNSGGGKYCDGAGTCVECIKDMDCASLACNPGHMCVAAQCDDKKKNGDETDVDCGGATCPPCGPGKGCSMGSDCKGGTCDMGTCAPSCKDGVKNGAETDIDCGGGACPACATTKICVKDADCLSGKCDAGTCADVLLLSQVETRGSNGGNDEFVEIYNPTQVAVIFDGTWSVAARTAVGQDMSSCAGAGLGIRFSGAGQTVQPHHYLLYVNGSMPGYNGPTPGDGTYSMGIPDAASVVLSHGGKTVDALCFSYDSATASVLTGCIGAPYICEGTPAVNPHNNTSGTNVDASLERKPGGAAGNGQDTNDNATDFFSQGSPEPRNVMSPAAP
jgi:hypothetical protein